MPAKIHTLPALSDNFCYIVEDTETDSVAVVDVPDAKVVTTFLESNPRCRLEAVLITHGHWDHCGGVPQLKAQYPQATVYAGAKDNVEGADQSVSQGSVVSVGSLVIEVLDTPCHTPGHVCFYIGGNPGAVFTGDTLFVGGCGNFNSGTPAQMHHALYEVLAKLPADTQVYVGHEYTEKNLRYASQVEPKNQDVARKLSWAAEARQRGQHTVPSTVREELSTNPFMRCNTPDVRSYTGLSADASTVDVLAAVRRLKDEWGRRK